MEDGKFITSAGVSAGIDMALALVARLTDEATARMVRPRQAALSPAQPRSLASSSGRSASCRCTMGPSTGS